MATSTRLAAARRTTLTTCLCAALAAGTGIGHADAVSGVTGNPSATRHASFSLFSNLSKRSGAREHVVSGNLIPVTKCEDDGTDGTLRKAIEGAADGDTIDMSGLSCSLITLQSGALVSPVPDLILKGPGIDALTIDGNDTDRVLQGAYLDISDLTIAHGSVTTGGGGVLANGDLTLTRAKIYSCHVANATNDGVGGGALVLGNLTMHDAVIAGNKVDGTDHAVGGGVAVGGTATLFDSTIAGNDAEASQAQAYGGGLFANGMITLHGSSITANVAHSTGGSAYGGGMHSPMSDLAVLDGSTITNNVVLTDLLGSHGGGVSSGTIYQQGPATVTLYNSTVSGNMAGSTCDGCTVGGGGVYAFDKIVAKYSTVDNNQAQCTDAMNACSASGGGLTSVGSQSDSRIFLYNSTISTNSALGSGQVGTSGTGGGMKLGVSEPFVADNTTIAFNHASDAGGGILASTDANNPAEMISTIVSNNDSGAGSDDISPDPLANGATITGSNDLVLKTPASVTLPADTVTTDPGLLPLTTGDGGITATHPLPPGSVAIDAGLNPTSLKCDQRGFPNHRVEGAAPDIGAYEAGEKHLFADNFDGTSICQ